MNLRLNYIFLATVWCLLVAAHEVAAVTPADLVVAIGEFVVVGGGLVQIAGHLFQRGIGKGAAHAGGLICFGLGGMAGGAHFGVDAVGHWWGSGLVIGAGSKSYQEDEEIQNAHAVWDK